MNISGVPNFLDKMLRGRTERLAITGLLITAIGTSSSAIFSWHLLLQILYIEKPTGLKWATYMILNTLSLWTSNEGRRTLLLARRHRASMPISMPVEDVNFVLYLRGFKEDASRGDTEIFAPLSIHQHSPLGLIYSLFAHGKTGEEHLVKSLRRIGPVITVGTPGEKLPPVGAGRLQMSPHSWQDEVRNLMRRARLVVLAMDPTPGTLWEFVEATYTIAPQRLILLVPPDSKTYETFRRMSHKLLRKKSTALFRRTGKRWPPPKLPYIPSIERPTSMSQLSGTTFYSAVIHFPSIRESRINKFEPLPLEIFGIVGPSLQKALRPALKNLLDFERTVARHH